MNCNLLHFRRSSLIAVLLSAGVALAARSASAVITVAPAYAGSYTASTIAGVPGVTSPYGGITFVPGSPNQLLIGGAANGAGGEIDSIIVTRGVGGHITGFAGSATLYATAPNIDGGLAFGPGGVLFYTAYPTNQLGEIKPGSVSPDKIVSLSPLGIGSSVGTLQFDPSGNLKIASYGTGTWYSAGLTPDGLGTFDVTGVANVPTANTFGGPEGIAYVPTGSPLFPTPSVLVSRYGAGDVQAYTLDAFGNPVASTGQSFISGLGGAEGATIDPVTGDFLFSTFGGGNQLVVVGGFAPPSSVPEPSMLVIFGFGLGLAGLWNLRRCRK